MRLFLLLSAFVASTTLASAADATSTPMPYFLPVSKVKVSATIKTKFEIPKGKDAEEVTVTSSLVTQADPTARLWVDIPKAFAADTSLEPSFATNGLLTAANGTSSGQLGAIVKDLFGFVTSIASIARFVPMA